MTLSEALSILSENNILTEFLQTEIPLNKLSKLFAKEYNLNIINIKPVLGYSDDIYNFWDISFKQNEENIRSLNNFKYSEIEIFFKKYGWQLSYFSTKNNCVRISKMLEKVSHDDFIKYIHMSLVWPQYILKTGLRTKSIHKRLYFFGLKTEKAYKEFLCDMRTTALPVITTNLNKKPEMQDYFYYYELNLPKNIEIYHDPECMGETKEQIPLYCYYNIPAKYIKYLGHD